MTKKYTNASLLTKINWEGGIMDALDYGISPDDIEDPKVASIWRDIQDHYLDLEPMIDDLMEILEADLDV